MNAQVANYEQNSF